MSSLQLSASAKADHNKILRVETEYRQSELVQNLEAAIYICDKEGYITYFNKAAAKLWGREPEIGKDLWCGSWKIFEADGITPLPLDTCPMAIALKEGRKVRDKEIIIERPDGVRRNVMPYPDPVFDVNGDVAEAVNMLVDITELKQKEHALAESEKRYRAIAEDLRNALRTQEEFISIASHELKTPITSINGFLHMLIEMHPEIKDERTNFMLVRSKAQIDRLIALINDLLDITKIKSGNLDLHLEEICLDDIVNHIVHEHSFTIATHVIIKKGENKNKVSCDKSRIEQVLSNIITNAAKYSPKADKIIVTISDMPKHVQVNVEDFGIGIPDESKHKVFNRFFRGNASHGSERLSSVGLGLYISANIIKRHKGKIWVDSEMGKGSIFHFSLPKINNNGN